MKRFTFKSTRHYRSLFKSLKSFACLWLLLLGFIPGFTQHKVITLDTSRFDLNQAIEIAEFDSWLFLKGNDTTWASPHLNSNGWEKIKPTGISKKMADKNGRIEGWFRIKLVLDSTFSGIPLELSIVRWAAVDIYLNGILIASKGNAGFDRNTFKYSYDDLTNTVPLPSLEVGKEFLIAVHFVNYIPAFPLNFITKDQQLGFFPLLTGPRFGQKHYEFYKELEVYYVGIISVCSVLAMLFWLLLYQNPKEKNLPVIAVGATFFAVALIPYFLNLFYPGSLKYYLWNNVVNNIFTVLMVLMIPVILSNIFTAKISNKLFEVIFIVAGIPALLNFIIWQWMPLTMLVAAVIVTLSLYLVISSRKTLKGAQWAVVFGVLFSLFWVIMWLLILWFGEAGLPFVVVKKQMLVVTGIYLSFPISLLAYVSLRFKEIMLEVRENAQRLVDVTEEKRQQALNQQALLEKQVKERTTELSQSLKNLKSTQSQLIQSEKMASLGELTAGIAHEIQNPLNFVNNFSEVNTELLNELQQELKAGKINDAISISNDIRDNSEKINHHGKRADAIVKGMLQHSQKSAGVKEPTDLNKLVDEYLRLSYQGFRAKYKSFNATINTDFDDSIGKINIIPQDIGRVVLNLINNAFYAVDEKKKLNITGYEPTVTVSTSRSPLFGRGVGGEVIIKVTDNGNGIPQKIVDKIFQPFFTTKPTGQGTGLGLSLSYDIIKAHSGEIRVETKEGEGTTFIIQLPVV